MPDKEDEKVKDSKEEQREPAATAGAGPGANAGVGEAKKPAKRTRWETSSLSDTLQDQPIDQEAIKDEIRKKSSHRSLLYARAESLAGEIDTMCRQEATMNGLEGLSAMSRRFEMAVRDAKEAHNVLMSYLIEIGTADRDLKATDDWVVTLEKHAADLEAKICNTQRAWQKTIYPVTGEDQGEAPSIMDMSIISQNATKAHAESMDKVMRDFRKLQVEEAERRERELRKVQEDRESELVRTQTALVQGLLVPKITVPTFSGKLTEDYTGWIRRFQNVYKIDTLGPETCFGELLLHLEGAAKDTVAGIKSDPNCMTVALALLKDQYGDDKLNYARLAADYRKGELCSSINEPVKLRALFNTISAMHRSGRSVGKQGDSTTIAMWLEKLPFQVHEAWEKKLVSDAADPDDCEAFIQMLRLTVRVREGLAPVIKARNEAKIKEKKAEKSEQKSTFATVAAAPAGRALVAQADGGAKPKSNPQQQQSQQKRQPKSREQAIKETGIDYKNCAMCEDSHDMGTCKLFTGKPLQERWNVIKSKRCCFSCLKRGHSKWQCHTKGQCKEKGCNQDHHTTLHG